MLLPLSTPSLPSRSGSEADDEDDFSDRSGNPSDLHQTLSTNISAADELVEELSTAEIIIRDSPAPSIHSVHADIVQSHAVESSVSVLYPMRFLERIRACLAPHDLDRESSQLI